MMKVRVRIEDVLVLVEVKGSVDYLSDMCGKSRYDTVGIELRDGAI